jgi:hypothetical protein
VEAGEPQPPPNTPSDDNAIAGTIIMARTVFFRILVSFLHC